MTSENGQFGAVRTPTPSESRGSVALAEGSAAKLHRRLSGDLDTIVLRALRKEPQRRYVSVEQFAEDIRRHLQGLPVIARRDSWSYRAGKFAIRHKLGVAATVLILLAVAGGVAATIREARIAAANARRAEERFNDVRKLANSLMFEIHDAINGLPGSTQARKLIVQRSLEYLDRLSKESAGDISLQRELANAYERIGLVQGDPDGSNLGDITGARDSFSKALTIREKVTRVSSQPNLSDNLALAASYREMCAISARYLGQIGTALDYCGRAVAKAEDLYHKEPADPQVQTELAKAYESTGTVYGQGSTSGNAGDSYAALEAHAKALNLIATLAKARPQDPDLTAWQGNLSLLTADDLFEIGKVSQAVPLYRQAMQTFEALTKVSYKTSYRDSLEFAYQRVGDMFLVAGRFEQASLYYRKQIDVSTAMVAADPKSMTFRTNLAASRATYGHALWRAGHVHESLASFRRGLAELAESKQQDARAAGLEAVLRLWMAGGQEKDGDILGALRNYMLVRDYYTRICESDPKDFEDCLSLAGTRDRVARIYLKQGRSGEALAEYEKALAITEPPSLGARPNLEAVYTVVNVYFGLGEVYASLADKSNQGAKSPELRSQSCAWYQKSHAAVSRISEWLPITPNEFDARAPKEIESRTSLCGSAANAGIVAKASTR